MPVKETILQVQFAMLACKAEAFKPSKAHMYTSTIMQLYKEGIRKPKEIHCVLGDRQAEEIPSLRQLNNYLVLVRRTIPGESSISIQRIRRIGKLKLATSKDKNGMWVVCGFEGFADLGNESNRFHIALTTP